MVKLTKGTYLKLIIIGVLCFTLCCGAVGVNVVGCSAARDVLDPPMPPRAPSAPEAPSFYAERGYVEVLADEISPEAFRNLSINWLAGSATVRAVPDDETGGMVRIFERIRGNVPQDQYLAYSIDGDWLNIEYFKNGPLVLFGCAAMGSKHLELLVPESVAAGLGELSLDVASGSYALEGVTFERMGLKLASGTLQATDVSAKSLAADLASGRLDVSGSIADAVSVDAASGEVSMHLADRMPGAIDLSFASGNMLFELPQDSGFTAAVDKISGSFNCGFASYQRDGAYVVGDGASKVTVSMTSGAATFRPAAATPATAVATPEAAKEA